VLSEKRDFMPPSFVCFLDENVCNPSARQNAYTSTDRAGICASDAIRELFLRDFGAKGSSKRGHT
jgi:hypothetical protein